MIRCKMKGTVDEDLVVVLQLLNFLDLEFPFLKIIHVNIHDIKAFAC